MNDSKNKARIVRMLSYVLAGFALITILYSLFIFFNLFIYTPPPFASQGFPRTTHNYLTGTLFAVVGVASVAFSWIYWRSTKLELPKVSVKDVVGAVFLSLAGIGIGLCFEYLMFIYVIRTWFPHPSSTPTGPIMGLIMTIFTLVNGRVVSAFLTRLGMEKARKLIHFGN